MADIAEQLKTAPPKIFVVVGLGVAALYFFLVYNDGTHLRAQIEQKKQELTTNQRNLDAARKTASEKAKFQEEINSVAEQLQAALEYLPTRLKVEEINKQIEDEARHAGVKLRKFLPQMPAAKGFYEELLVEVELEGSYANLTLFLSYITQLTRIINIRGLELLKAQTANVEPGISLKLKGTLVGYRYLEAKQ